MTFLVVEDRREVRRKGCVYVRRKGVVKLVINGCERLGSNQAEIRPRVVPPGFWGSANRGTYYIPFELRFLRPDRGDCAKMGLEARQGDGGFRLGLS